MKPNSGSFKKGIIPWMKGKTHTDDSKKKLSIAHKGRHHSISTEFKKGQTIGKKNVKWKGSKVGYYALHDWVYRYKGKPKICKHCGGFKNVEWANKSLEYKRDLKDWDSLCRKCHFKYDRANGWGKATKKYPELGKS